MLISELCQGLLADLYDGAEDCEVALPANRWVNHESPPADCELLVIYPQLINPTAASFGRRDATCASTVDLTIGCEWWVCWPQPDENLNSGSSILTPALIASMEQVTLEQVDVAEYVHARGIQYLTNGGVPPWERRSVVAATRALRPRGAMMGWQVLWTIRELIL